MFTLTEESLWKLWRQNQFLVPDQEVVFFGLRGCLPLQEDDWSFGRQQRVGPAELNYRNPRCTLGQWVPEKGFALFPGSTVPHQRYIQKAQAAGGQGANQLITGFYTDYRKGVHRSGSKTGHQAFRQEQFLPVRRTSDDLDYDPKDRVDWSQASDNLHCAWCMSLNKEYSSAGCQVVLGYPKTPWGRADNVDSGPWKVFLNNAYALAQNSFSYVLLDGRDALKAAQPDAALIPRLRYGSAGELVKLVQEALKAGQYYEGKIDGALGWRTLSAVMQFQKAKFGLDDADGVVGPITAEALGVPWPGAAHASEAVCRPMAIETRAAVGECRYEGNDALAPDGARFGKKCRNGLYNYGKTTIGDFIRLNRGAFADLPPSMVRVMEAVSANEGNLEALNTWDNAFLSFGILQWTAGAGTGAGELPALLGRLKQEYAAVFQELFGRHGLDVRLSPGGALGKPGFLPTGYFSLGGELLKTEAQKERLRTLEWAYRFWRAGQNDLVRVVQIKQAMDRIRVFYRSPRHQINGRPIADYVSSESGVALLLDQHVNRPGHVPATLAKAVSALGAGDPQQWSDHDEARLLDLYIDLRAKTTMTDSSKRRNAIFEAADDGIISRCRGSFKE